MLRATDRPALSSRLHSSVENKTQRKMCGRARCSLRPDDIPRACHRNNSAVRSVDLDRYRPSHNVAPGFNLPVIRRGDGSDGDAVVLHCMKWGLIPSFTKKTEKPDFFKMFNARSESVQEKASFRRLLPKNRCLLAVEGFYEWKKEGSQKQPYYIHFKDGRPLVFASIYDCWENTEGEKLYSFTIITTSASSTLKWLHDRMPVILGDKESTDAWLAGSSKYDALLKPYEGLDLAWYPVTPAMGKLSFDGPECIKEITLKKAETNSISKFFSRKEVKEEQPSRAEKLPQDESVGKDFKTEPHYEDDESLGTLPVEVDSKDVKQEAKTEEAEVPASPTQEHDQEPCKSLAGSDEAFRGTKRNFKDISGEAKPDRGGAKDLSSPARRKGGIKSGGDQPTLLAYFGKK